MRLGQSYKGNFNQTDDSLEVIKVCTAEDLGK